MSVAGGESHIGCGWNGLGELETTDRRTVREKLVPLRYLLYSLGGSWFQDVFEGRVS